MSANMEALIEAGRLLVTMKKCVTVYEATVIANNDGIEVQLSSEQVTQLKQDFAAARAACIAELNKVSG